MGFPGVSSLRRRLRLEGGQPRTDPTRSRPPFSHFGPLVGGGGGPLLRQVLRPCAAQQDRHCPTAVAHFSLRRNSWGERSAFASQPKHYRNAHSTYVQRSPCKLNPVRDAGASRSGGAPLPWRRSSISTAVPAAEPPPQRISGTCRGRSRRKPIGGGFS